MGGIIVWSGPTDEEEETRRLRTSGACWVHGDFDIKNGMHLVGGTVDKILSGWDGLVRDWAVRKLGVGGVGPREKFADMENRVNTRHGGGEGEFNCDRGNDGRGGERAEETRAELG